MSVGAKRVLIYGGRGSLGAVCVSFFKSQLWWVGSIDLAANEEANANVIVEGFSGWDEQEKLVLSQVENVLEGNKVDAIICVAGGWAGGNSASDDLVKNSDLMIKQSVWSSLIASKLAAKYMNEGGLLALTGAKAALEPTPGMIGYGLAKAAVHQLTRSLAAGNSGLPKDSTVLAILPVTLDTPMNRKFMPKGDFSTWTPLTFVSNQMFKWASSGESRPVNGSLVQLITHENQTELILTPN